MKRRAFNATEEIAEDLEAEILKALRNAEPGDYGNLDKHGNFFRLASLTTVPVKLSVIDKLVKDNKITLAHYGALGALGATYYKIAAEGVQHA